MLVTARSLDVVQPAAATAAANPGLQYVCFIQALVHRFDAFCSLRQPPLPYRLLRQLPTIPPTLVEEAPSTGFSTSNLTVDLLAPSVRFYLFVVAQSLDSRFQRNPPKMPDLMVLWHG